MEFFIFFIIAAIVIFVIAKFVKNMQHNRKSSKVFDDMPNFNVTKKYLSNTSGISIAYDSVQEKICFLDEGHNLFIFNYNDIIQSELDIDGKTIFKKSTSGSIGRALVGGVLAGGVGALVGGTTGKQNQKEKITKVDLKIIVNNPTNPLYRINFMDMEVDKSNFIYKNAYKNAEMWHGIISSLIKQGEDSALKADNNNLTSTADEIIKLKQLLDSGVLTKGEFENQKNKILL
jgi:hypothetical protein